MLTAVLPPIAASVTASSVVGSRTTRTPRSQLAATNPARSVVAPPPMPTIASSRVTRWAASRDQSPAATAMSLAASPAGTSSAWTRYPAAASAPHAGPTISASPAGWMTTTVRAALPTRDGSSPSTPVPMTTSYAPPPGPPAGPARASGGPVCLDHRGRSPAISRAGTLAHVGGDAASDGLGDEFRDLRGLPVVGGHGQPGEALVDRAPLLQEFPHPASRVPRQRRARAVQARAARHGREPCSQVHDALPGQQPPRASVKDGATAEREDPVVPLDRLRHGGLFQRAERRLAVVYEDVADRLAHRLLDDAVGVKEADAEQPGDQRAHG